MHTPGTLCCEQCEDEPISSRSFPARWESLQRARRVQNGKGRETGQTMETESQPNLFGQHRLAVATPSLAYLQGLKMTVEVRAPLHNGHLFVSPKLLGLVLGQQSQIAFFSAPVWATCRLKESFFRRITIQTLDSRAPIRARQVS